MLKYILFSAYLLIEYNHCFTSKNIVESIFLKLKRKQSESNDQNKQ